MGMMVVGILAALSPFRERALVCEHCANIFGRTEVRGRTADRAIGFALLLISLAVVIGVVVLFVWALIVLQTQPWSVTKERGTSGSPEVEMAC